MVLKTLEVETIVIETLVVDTFASYSYSRAIISLEDTGVIRS